MQCFLVSWLPLVYQVNYFPYSRFPLQGLHLQTDPLVWFVWLHEGSLISVPIHVDCRLWFLVWFSSHRPRWELLFLASDQRGALALFLGFEIQIQLFLHYLFCLWFLCLAMFHCLLQRFHQFECCFDDFDFRILSSCLSRVCWMSSSSSSIVPVRP